VSGMPGIFHSTLADIFDSIKDDNSSNEYEYNFPRISSIVSNFDELTYLSIVKRL
jgi:hypothetical protein